MTEHTLPANMLMQLAQELEVKQQQIAAAVKLLDEGATVPFIARYRKEVTEGLTDTHLRQLEERLDYLRDLQSQKETALKTIKDQGKLTQSLELQIQEALTKQALADLYQPYRPKRRSKATQAIEAGLEPLALKIWDDPTNDPETLAQEFISEEKGVPTVKAALDGARHILAETWADKPLVVQTLRDYLRSEAHIISKVKKAPQASTPASAKTSTEDKTEKTDQEAKARSKPKKNDQTEKKAAKFSDYFDRHEQLTSIASHRTLALFRGRRENVLDLSIDIPDLPDDQLHPCVGRLHQLLDFTPSGRAADDWLAKTMQWCWRVKLHTKLENDLMAEIKESADKDSIQVFARNLEHLLMSAPAGNKATLGLDPGLRTGVKIAVISDTGQVLDHCAIYPHAPKNQWEESKAALKALCEKYNVALIAVGNGTASRETDKLVTECIKENTDLQVKKAIVNESGASIYSASEFASRELPDLDVAIRGAVSIARRLQDPLAELVKIEPKSIGVGQYQHDVSQPKLAKSLEAVVIDCVNSVGVDVNTASEPLLARIAGLNDTIAHNIVAFRQEQGPFKNRAELKKIPRLGQRTFEQAAGFLRVLNGENPLDATAVHPESYPVVMNMAQKLGIDVQQLIRNKEALEKIAPEEYTSDAVGLPTVLDVIQELEKPGRDPRPEFSTVTFRDDVLEISDLKQDMILDGIVTNVTNFGAFVDVGVHQDGLVHISALTDKFVSDPHTIVKTGDKVKVKVLNADVERNRIDLTMRLQESAQKEAAPRQENFSKKTQNRQPNSSGGQNSGSGRTNKNRPKQSSAKPSAAANTPKVEKALPPGKTGTFADLFAQLKQ